MSIRNILISMIMVTVSLCGIAIFATHNYEWNISALLHVGKEFGELYHVPSGIVLYEDGGYDGELYYQIARNLPQYFQSEEIADIPLYDNTYRLQRILLPLFAYISSGGKESFLPYSIVLVNILAITCSLGVLLLMAKKISIHSLCIVCNPAALVGILFSLSEPLSILFLTLALFLWERAGKMMTLSVVGMLILSLLARETTIFLIVLFGIYFLWKCEWKQFAFSAVPLAFFLGWQFSLTWLFDTPPLSNGIHMLNIPLIGPFNIILKTIADPNAYTLSAFSLLILFILPLAGFTIREWFIRKQQSLLLFVLAGLTGTMLTMDTHIWGVITSIGRVVAPIYPIYALYAIRHDSRTLQILSCILIFVSIVTAGGIASMSHPYIIT